MAPRAQTIVKQLNEVLEKMKVGKHDQAATKVKSLLKKFDEEQKKEPKKLSKYNIFYRDEYKNIKEMYPNKSAPEIAKSIAIKWRELKEAK